MFNQRIPRIALAITVALTLGACGRDKAPETPSASPRPIAAAASAATEAPATEEPDLSVAAPSAPAAQSDSASPLATPVAGSPLSTPSADSPMPTPKPNVSGLKGAPTSETGSVTGRVIIRRDGVDTPVAGVIVGLAELIRDESGVPRASGYSADSAKKGVTDTDGGFVVNNVVPGVYSIILDAVVTSYQLIDETTDETILVDVKAGETNDIGVHYYSSLPLPGYLSQ